MDPYTDSLDPIEQVEAEVWIASTIADTVNHYMFDANLDDEVARDMGQRILHEVLRRFRPDLLGAE